MERRTGFFPATRGQVSSSGAELRNCSHPGFRRGIGTAESESAHCPAHCPGLELRGRTWYLQIYHAGERKIIKVGRDLDRVLAVHIAKAQREAVKNGKVMAALVCGQGSG